MKEAFLYERKPSGKEKLKVLSLLVIILLSFSSVVFAEGETTAPAADTNTKTAPSEPSATPSDSVVGAPAGDTSTAPADSGSTPAPTDSSNTGTTTTQQPTTENREGEAISEPREESEVSKGIREGKCYVGEKEVPCPTSRSACPPANANEQDKLKCSQSGGNYNTRDDGGCPRFECMFNQNRQAETKLFNQCPTREEIDNQIKKCQENGLRTLMKNVNGCGYVECQGNGQQQNQMATEQNGCKKLTDIPGPEREQCENKGDYRLIEIYNSGNCPEIQCVPTVKARGIQCENEGGKLVVNGESERCVKVSNSDEISYDPIDEVPDAAKILKIVISLDKLSIELDNLAKEMDDLAVYFGEQDAATGERYRKAALMIKSGKHKIIETKERLRANIRNLQPQDLEDVRKDLKILKESIFEEAVYVLLSGESSSEALVEEVTYEGNDCKNDGRCFTSKLKTCEEGVTYNADEKTTVTIEQIEEDKCKLKIELRTSEKTYDMECKYPNYAFGLGSPEELIPYCDGSLVELMKEKINNGEVGQGRAEKMQQITQVRQSERAFGQNSETLNRNEQGNICQTEEQVIRLKQECSNQGQDAIVENRDGCPWVVCIDKGIDISNREMQNVRTVETSSSQAYSMERVVGEEPSFKENIQPARIVEQGQQITAQVIKFLRGEN
ncbi:hypothetical protein J4405_04410 [Candidatus Woesearchaeota archaeon]|nr:hypothetical protein [Candidatus Woesearchaeota archaeon]